MYPRLSDLLTDAFGIHFPLPIYSFGAMVATAILLAGWLLARELDRMHAAGQIPAIRVPAAAAAAKAATAGGRSRARAPRAATTAAAPPSAIVNRLVILAAIGGVAGSKLFHILENLDVFAADPIGTIFSSGGLTFYGGLITAALLIAWTVRRAGLPVPRVADAVAPGLILGYGIGRIGCYLAGDGDWGVCSRLADKPAGLPARLWSETFPRNILGLDIPGGVCAAGFDGVYPTMLYEFAMCLAAFGLLWALRRHRFGAGWLFGLYLVLTGVERFLIELIRVNNVGTYLGIPATQAQVISVVLAVAGVAIMVRTMQRRERAPVVEAEAPVVEGWTPTGMRGESERPLLPLQPERPPRRSSPAVAGEVAEGRRGPRTAPTCQVPAPDRSGTRGGSGRGAGRASTSQPMSDAMPDSAADLRATLVTDLLARVSAWESAMPPVAVHPSMAIDAARLDDALGRFGERLGGSYPFFHPRYAGQMLKPPHPVALAAYAATAAINPNNHALDGGPATSAMEQEAVAALASMIGYAPSCLGHLTSGGTVANLDALFIAREVAAAAGQTGGAVLHSAAAHYTHSRMAHVLGMPSEAIATDADGRMDVDALDARLARGGVTVVVATAGTTGTGAVDPVADILDVATRHGVRVHVDAAYGGFFALLARDASSEGAALLGAEVCRHFAAIERADSVVLDPHKHGLQPYGCGAVLFRDPHVARFYAHDSPYTYFTTGLAGGQHLGETTLECSRAGASAAAIWLTIQVLPLDARTGFGPVLTACLRAARTWQAAVEASVHLRAVGRPVLDIVAYHPAAPTASAIDATSAALFAAAQRAGLHTALFVTGSARLDATPDVPTARILRSVLMKPEHETQATALVAELDALAGAM